MDKTRSYRYNSVLLPFAVSVVLVTILFFVYHFLRTVQYNNADSLLLKGSVCKLILMRNDDSSWQTKYRIKDDMCIVSGDFRIRGLALGTANLEVDNEVFKIPVEDILSFAKIGKHDDLE